MTLICNDTCTPCQYQYVCYYTKAEECNRQPNGYNRGAGRCASRCYQTQQVYQCTPKHYFCCQAPKQCYDQVQYCVYEVKKQCPPKECNREPPKPKEPQKECREYYQGKQLVYRRHHRHRRHRRHHHRDHKYENRQRSSGRHRYHYRYKSYDGDYTNETYTSRSRTEEEPPKPKREPFWKRIFKRKRQ